MPLNGMELKLLKQTFEEKQTFEGRVKWDKLPLSQQVVNKRGARRALDRPPDAVIVPKAVRVPRGHCGRRLGRGGHGESRGGRAAAGRKVPELRPLGTGEGREYRQAGRQGQG